MKLQLHAHTSSAAVLLRDMTRTPECAHSPCNFIRERSLACTTIAHCAGAVRLETCATTEGSCARQQWTQDAATGTITNGGGLCLSAAGMAVGLQTCAPAASMQSWSLAYPRDGNGVNTGPTFHVPDDPCPLVSLINSKRPDMGLERLTFQLADKSTWSHHTRGCTHRGHHFPCPVYVNQRGHAIYVPC